MKQIECFWNGAAVNPWNTESGSLLFMILLRRVLVLQTLKDEMLN